MCVASPCCTSPPLNVKALHTAGTTKQNKENGPPSYKQKDISSTNHCGKSTGTPPPFVAEVPRAGNRNESLSDRWIEEALDMLKREQYCSDRNNFARSLLKKESNRGGTFTTLCPTPATRYGDTPANPSIPSDRFLSYLFAKK